MSVRDLAPALGTTWPDAGPLPCPSSTRRRLEVALGALWLLDGALQFQPYMFTREFFAGILGMANMGLPGPVSSADFHLAGFLVAHPAFWNSVFASLQVALGAGLLWPSTARVARALSIPWALGVWVVGEGFGGLFMGGTSLLTGAPGAALLYGVIAVALWPSPRRGQARAHFALGSWALVWWTGALLELGTTNHLASVPAAQISDTAAGQLAPLRIVNDAVARLLMGHGALFAVVLGLAGAGIGLGALLPRTRRLALVAGGAVGVFVGVVGQDLGGLFNGQATDPGSGPLLVLLALTVHWATQAAVAPGRTSIGAATPALV